MHKDTSRFRDRGLIPGESGFGGRKAPASSTTAYGCPYRVLYSSALLSTYGAVESSTAMASLRRVGSRTHHSPSRFSCLMLIALVASVVVNVVQFPAIEEEGTRWYRATPAHESTELVEITADQTRTARHLYQFDVELDALTEDPVLVVSPESPLLSRYRIHIAVERIEISDRPMELSDDELAYLMERADVQGEDAQLGKYLIAVEDYETGYVYELMHDEMRVFVDEATLEAVR